MWLKATSMGQPDHTRPYKLFVDSIGRHFFPSHKGLLPSDSRDLLATENLSAMACFQCRCPRPKVFDRSLRSEAQKWQVFYFLSKQLQIVGFCSFLTSIVFQQILSVVLFYFPVRWRFPQVHRVPFLWFLSRIQAISVTKGNLLSTL